MNRQTVIRLLIIVALILAVSMLHYTTTIQKAHFHDIFRRLYYIPIVLGGLWFTLRGGLGTAIVVSVVYAPHILLQWGHHPGIDVAQYLEILVYNVIGTLTGFLSQRELAQKMRYLKTSIRLEESYEKLRGQADQLLEIEEQLRRADRLSAMGELSAGMAHEIRNPLASIKGTAEILRDGMDRRDKKYEFAQILVREVDRLENVVRDFLSFARPDGGVHEEVQISAALSDVLILTRQQALKSQVEIRYDCQTTLPLITGNFEHLKQAFLNFVLNALQVMPKGGVLTIQCEVNQRILRIAFADTGPGIPKELQERVFNPFYTTRQEGTGLGLAITHRIIDAHGGRIKLESQPGEGATFTVELPIDKREENL
ncbi:MAG: sensor histidine kinase [Desulfuromonadales bacterium]|nr:sensor histidine kinase [Desulfuromonadales bacterium]